MLTNASTNANEVLRELHDAISEQQTAHTDSFFIIGGDFTMQTWKLLHQSLNQHVNFATRDDNILDLFYTNVRYSHKAIPRPTWDNQTTSACCSFKQDLMF